jgi:copper chaperone
MRLQIEGMSCEHCVKAVTKALAGVPGITRVVEVSLPRGEAIVEGSPEPSATVRAITDAGYTARVVG